MLANPDNDQYNDHSSNNNCTITCQRERFDLGKDCFDANEQQCQCIGHCCWAFDCRPWNIFAQCRKKCKILDWSRFGKSTNHHKLIDCNYFPCYSNYIINKWDLRNVNQTTQINCIQHCCYAFNCKKFSGYCREFCLQRN